MALFFNPKRSCQQVMKPPSSPEEMKTCQETLDKLVKAFDRGNPDKTLDAQELGEILGPLQVGGSQLKRGAPEAVNVLLDTLAEQQMMVGDSYRDDRIPVSFAPEVFKILKRSGMAYLLGKTPSDNENRINKLQQMQEQNEFIPPAPLVLKAVPFLSPPLSPPPEQEEKIDFPDAFKKWFLQQEKEMAWKLPSFGLDFGGKPVIPFFGIVNGRTVATTPRFTMDIALESARTLWNYLEDAHHWRENRSGRFVTTLGSLPITLAKSFIIHESGHVRRTAENGWYVPSFKVNVASILEYAGGLEATQQASEERMRSPYTGPEGDLLRFVLQEDLMFYRRFSEPIVMPMMGATGKGDPSVYLKQRKAVNGGADETWALETVAAWETLDPEAIRSLLRWYDYIQTGKVSEKVFKAGYTTAAFNGYLAPGGPLLEASGYYYLNTPSAYPSFVKGTLWASPVEHLGETTMGAGLELHHLPIPKLDLWGVQFAIGGEFSIWNQPTHFPDYEFHSSMLSGGLSLYFEKKPVTISLSGLCKDAGYLPQTPIDAGCYPSASIRLNFADGAE